MIYYEEDFTLTIENVGRISDRCEELYKELIQKKRQYPPVKFRLETEEILEHMRTTYGDDVKCTLRCRKYMFSSHVEFIVYGESINPLINEDEILAYSKQILSMYGVEPSYTYNRNFNHNIVSVDMIKKPVKNKFMLSIFAALLLAVLSRLLLGLLPDDVLNTINEDIVSLIFTKMTTIITEVATFLVFFSVVTGITGIGSSATLNKIGKKLTAGSGLTYLFSAVVFTAIALVLYPVTSASGAGESVIKQILQLILDVIPDNLIDCFLQDNDLQVITLAVFTGAILLGMGGSVEKINEALLTLSDIINKMMAVICKALPLVVYFGILNMLLSDMSEVASVYKVAVIFFGAAALIIAFLFIRVKLATGISAITLFKHQWPTALINLTTSSQVAAIPENKICLKKKFGIDSNFVDFALPLCIVAYMPCGVGFLGGTVYGLADLSGIPIDITFIIKLAVMAVIVAIAAPPIPGSAFAVLPIMLAGTGVPNTYYSLAIILGSLLGYVTPLLNGYCMQLEMLIVSARLNLIDKTVLGIKK